MDGTDDPPVTGISMRARRPYTAAWWRPDPPRMRVDGGAPEVIAWGCTVIVSTTTGEHEVEVDDGELDGPASTVLWVDEGEVVPLEYRRARAYYAMSRIAYLDP